jgi:hypothetical protein
MNLRNAVEFHRAVQEQARRRRHGSPVRDRKLLIGLYIGKQGVESTYGAAASLVVLLIWVYYSSQLVPMGAEFMRIHAKRRTLKSPSAGWLWRCFSGGCSATSANAISAPAERASGRPSRRSCVCFALTATKFDEPQRRVANG